MGIWRFAGSFGIVERQGELKISEANAGAKTAKCTLAANAHRRVLAVRCFFRCQSKVVSIYKSSTQNYFPFFSMNVVSTFLAHSGTSLDFSIGS